MRSFARIKRHLQIVTLRLRASEGEKLLSDAAMGDLIGRYKVTGELPSHPLQRTHILFFMAALAAMDGTCQVVDDPHGQDKFVASQWALVEAARAYNAELRKHGLPLVEEELPPKWFNEYGSHEGHSTTVPGDAGATKEQPC